jgi:hypothetical protein
MKYRLLGKSDCGFRSDARRSQDNLASLISNFRRTTKSSMEQAESNSPGIYERNGSCNKIWRHVGSLAALSGPSGSIVM